MEGSHLTKLKEGVNLLLSPMEMYDVTITNWIERNTRGIFQAIVLAHPLPAVKVSKVIISAYFNTE